MSRLSHLDAKGATRMVDVSDKPVTAREAMAEAVIVLSPEAYEAAKSGNASKGDVLGTARIAGIMAAKKTAELIPLCHPLPLAKADIDFEWLDERSALRIVARAKTEAQTGVEMEALTAAAIAALTVYDMVKAVDKGAVVETIRLLTKSGGKSGPYRAPIAAKPNARAKPQVLMGEVAIPRADPNAERDAFRTFMSSHRLRATQWANQAGVSAAQIYGYLTGRARKPAPETLEKLARAARVRVEDMFR
jgi:cyclic pyranopterin monophosphate synthase